VEQARLIDTSNQLHERVQRFATGESTDTFEALALALAQFQAEASPGFRRLIRARRASLQSVDDIPAVPSDAFRLTRVAAHSPKLDAMRFFTSGTSGAERGTHAMRRTDTYARLSLRFGAAALLAAAGVGAATAGVRDGDRAVVVALAPAPSEPPSSSLGYMMARFMEAFDGRPLDGAEEAFDSGAPLRWLVSEAGADLAGLRRAVRAAEAREKPLLILGTAFALVSALDQLAGDSLPLPAGSSIMQTGGFKGRSRELSAPELRAHLSRAFRLAEARIVGEYGMTELTSQLYEATIVESELGRSERAAGAGVYLEPAWLRVTPVDPLTLLPLPEGQTGLARFIDLGNVDSAVSVVTQDLVRRVDGGIQLLGRQPGATPRGCSLAIEALLGG
jgi:hypothetical protein